MQCSGLPENTSLTEVVKEKGIILIQAKKGLIIFYLFFKQFTLAHYAIYLVLNQEGELTARNVLIQKPKPNKPRCVALVLNLIAIDQKTRTRATNPFIFCVQDSIQPS